MTESTRASDRELLIRIDERVRRLEWVLNLVGAAVIIAIVGAIMALMRSSILRSSLRHPQ